MRRIAVFLVIVLLVFQAGVREFSTKPPRQAAPGVEVRTFTSRIAGPALAVRERPIARLPNTDRLDAPRPFDLSQSTLADPASLAAGPERQEPGARLQVVAPRVSLRAGPSPLYPELATLPRGALVIAAGMEIGDWLWVRAQGAGLSGYVAAGLVTHAQ